MQIERALLGVETLGPGKRLAIWVNGCKRKCPNCVSPRLQHFCALNEVSIEEYFSGFDFSIVDGVTISGGEPFEQIAELNHLVQYLAHNKKIEDILVYTGYTIEELKAKRDLQVTSILNNIAVLVDGPYVEELDTGKGNLKGSDNQRIIFLKPEYQSIYMEYIAEERSIQVFEFNRYVVAAGIPNRNIIKDFMERL